MLTPLNMIIFFVERVSFFINGLSSVSGSKKDNAIGQIELILCQLLHMKSFVNDLLDLQQIKDGMFSLVQKPFDPNTTLDMVCRMFTPTAEAANVFISWHSVRQLQDLSDTKMTSVANFLPDQLVGDERRLMQVLTNLVKNAIKFTSDGEIQIKVFYDYQAENLVVHVCDTGTTIARDRLPELLDGEANQQNDDTSLGLTIVKKIVERSGGQVRVDSGGLRVGNVIAFTMQMGSINQHARQIPEQSDSADSNLLENLVGKDEEEAKDPTVNTQKVQDNVKKYGKLINYAKKKLTVRKQHE